MFIYGYDIYKYTFQIQVHMITSEIYQVDLKGLG